MQVTSGSMRARRLARASGVGSGMVYPPGYRFVHNLPNKPLSGYDLENKRDAAKINKTLELWFLWSLEEGHKPAADGFCLDLKWEYIG